MVTRNAVIALDGPSGVGKSTISRKLAANLEYTYLDTGAMYRAVGLHFQRHQVEMDDKNAVKNSLDSITLHLLPPENEVSDTGVLLNGEDVSKEIRTPEISMLASRVSAIPAVRKFLTQMQRKMGEQGKIIAEGRDIGTVVFPNAKFKFFLDADINERARRRTQQLRQNGKAVEEEDILEMIAKRDRDDRERSVAPLKKANDAVLIDTTGITIEEVCEIILSVVLRQ